MLPALDMFRTAVTFGAAMDALPARTALDFIELSSEIVKLYEHGFLVSGEKVRVEPYALGYDGARSHIGMLGDRPRTKGYVEAIRATVKPGDVVVDVGTGTGVLSIAAAQAGAKKVYAIERSGIAGVAERLFAANGVADRIELVHGTSTEVTLPERADVMVSELVGNDPFDEQILSYTRDAIARLLVPQPRMVPRRLIVDLVPVSAPAAIVGEHFFQPEAVADWTKNYGIDFTALAAIRPPAPQLAMLARETAAKLVPRGAPARLCDIDLMQPPATVDHVATVVVDQPAPIDGVLMVFALDLAEGHEITSSPWEAEGARHWGLPFWIFPESRAAAAGDGFALRYEFAGVKATLTFVDASD
jgi:protein arginine N-methyltransferase 1